MDFGKKLLALLVIFCVVASASAVFAEEGGYAGSNYQDDGGYAGSQYSDDAVDDGDQVETHEGGPEIDPDYAHSEGAAGEPINATGNETGNSTVGNSTTGNATGNATGNVTANQTNSTNPLQNMLSTGNPIFLLIIVVVIVGAYAVYRRGK